MMLSYLLFEYYGQDIKKHITEMISMKLIFFN
jgi:hypothetical protein